MFARRTLTLFLAGAAVLAIPAIAFADDAPAATAVAPPSTAAIAAADQILIAMGVKQSIATMVPTMLGELEQNVTTTRPEIKDSLRQTLKAIQPDFDKGAQEIYEKAEAQLTFDMSEKELQDVAGFFGSESGKKFLATQPVLLQQLSGIIDPWRQKISSDIVTRAREEMKKKGVEF